MNRKRVLYSLIFISSIIMLATIILGNVKSSLSYWHECFMFLNSLAVIIISTELLFMEKWRREECWISLIVASIYTTASLVSITMIIGIDVNHVAFYGMTGNVINVVSAGVFWLLFWLAKERRKK